MSETMTVARVLVDCAHLTPGLYRNVETGAVVEIRQPDLKKTSAPEWTPGLRLGRAVRNAPQAFISLMSPLDEAGQMMIATMLKTHEDL